VDKLTAEETDEQTHNYHTEAKEEIVLGDISEEGTKGEDIAGVLALHFHFNLAFAEFVVVEFKIVSIVVSVSISISVAVQVNLE
jgi:hypothetical protein